MVGVSYDKPAAGVYQLCMALALAIAYQIWRGPRGVCRGVAVHTVRAVRVEVAGIG